MEKPYCGRLENWKECMWFGGKMLVIGNIYEDPRRKFVDGKYIQTSEIVKVDYKLNKLETLNSLYDLGKPSTHLNA